MVCMLDVGLDAVVNTADRFASEGVILFIEVEFAGSASWPLAALHKHTTARNAGNDTGVNKTWGTADEGHVVDDLYFLTYGVWIFHGGVKQR